jgi:cyclopropane-fatty-acyl-phospholipid synthase
MEGLDQAKKTSLAILDKIFSKYPRQDFAVRLWDGTVWPPGGRPSASFTLVLNHPGALRKMFLLPSELNLGEA